MTRPLPERDVEARATRGGRPRLSAVDEKALASIKDENLKRVLGELLESTRRNQANFDELEQWFPVHVEHPERYGPGLRYRYCANAPENEGTKKGPGNFFGETLPAQNLYITVKNLEEVDVSKYLAEWDDSTTSAARGYVFVTQPGVSDVLLVYRINGNATLKEPAGKEKYYKIPATLLVVGAVPAAFDQTIELTFYRTGDEGSGGGEEGGGASGFLYAYNPSTANADPGTGKLSINSATFSGTTASLRLSKTDGDGNALAAFLANLDDSLGSPRGEVVIRKKGAAKAFAVLKITGSLTNSAEWVSFPVTFVAGEGLGGGDELYLQFDRFGVESYSLLESEDGIEWKQESKTLRERIRGYYDGVNHILEMIAGEGEEVSLKAFLRLYGGGSKALARVVAGVGAAAKTILDGEERSSFVQLSAIGKKVVDLSGLGAAETLSLFGAGSVSKFLQLTAAENRQVKWGVAKVTFPGASTVSNSTIVAHGLGKKPVLILVTSVPTAGGQLSLGYFFTPTEAQFTIRCYGPATPAAADSAEVYWLAIA